MKEIAFENSIFTMQMNAEKWTNKLIMLSCKLLK